MDSAAMNELPPSPLTSRKRSHDGMVIPPSQNSSHDKATETYLPTPSSGTPSLGAAHDRSRQASPALSTTSSSLTDLTDITGEASKTSVNGTTVPAKKRKLTYAEKQVRDALKKEQKDAREKQKAEDKARREEDKRARDEEKRKKEEEKEEARREKELEKAEKQKEKDAKKAAKDEEKRKKEEEKLKKEAEQLKKERSQMKLGAFFGKPSVPSTPPPCSPEDASSGVSSRRSSIASIDNVVMQDVKSPSPVIETNPEYEKLFPSFFVHPYTEVAPANRFPCRKLTSDLLAIATSFETSSNNLPRLQDSFKSRPHGQYQASRKPKSVRAVVDEIQGSSNAPIDLTVGQRPLRIENLLNGVPLKVFSFQEDVRPGYQGTYTRPVSPRSTLKLCRHPFGRNLPDTNYDYDSEAEWEPPEEGDDDVDAVDEESSDEEEDDMEEFLDDEDDIGRRRLIVGNQEPQCSGLCWQGEQDQDRTVSRNEGNLNMKDFRMEIISEEHRFPVDPFSPKYWEKKSCLVPPSVKAQLSPNPANLMQPPRLPLQASSQTNVLFGLGPPTATIKNESSNDAENSNSPSKLPTTQPGAKQSQKPLKLISNDLLPAFRQAVSGSDLNKVGLVEILKKQFPKTPKDVIRDTLSAVAVRQGVKEADKRWVLIDPL